MNLCSRDVNSQWLLCSQKAGVNWSYLAFQYTKLFKHWWLLRYRTKKLSLKIVDQLDLGNINYGRKEFNIIKKNLWLNLLSLVGLKIIHNEYYSLRKCKIWINSSNIQIIPLHWFNRLVSDLNLLHIFISESYNKDHI